MHEELTKTLWLCAPDSFLEPSEAEYGISVMESFFVPLVLGLLPQRTQQIFVKLPSSVTEVAAEASSNLHARRLLVIIF